MTKLLQLLSVLAGFAAAVDAVSAGPPVRTSIGIGVNIGAPGPYYRPYYAPAPYYYRPYPYYYYPPAAVVVPGPVVYQQPVVVQQQPTVVQQAPAVVTQPAPVYSSPPSNVVQTSQPAGPSVDGFLANLRSQEESVRRDSVLELGRMKAAQAVQPLTATLAGDQSPVVRDAAARALGLIGSPQALTALNYSAQADPDRDVRRSAQFAADVIRSNSR